MSCSTCSCCCCCCRCLCGCCCDPQDPVAVPESQLAWAGIWRGPSVGGVTSTVIITPEGEILSSAFGAGVAHHVDERPILEYNPRGFTTRSECCGWPVHPWVPFALKDPDTAVTKYACFDPHIDLKRFGPAPVVGDKDKRLMCPYCSQHFTPRLRTWCGPRAWLWCLLTGPLSLCCQRDKEYICSECHASLSQKT
eukprot:m51a1_g8852 hypothetical protein (195) ;mRNA; f:492077-492865